jgi:hypothetical protein
MDIKQKIKSLVAKGYTQGAFRNKSNALKFKREWEKKGYKVGYLRSSGKVVEGGWQDKAYYMIADKVKKKGSIPLQKLKSKIVTKKATGGDWITKETNLSGGW